MAYSFRASTHDINIMECPIVLYFKIYQNVQSVCFVQLLVLNTKVIITLLRARFMNLDNLVIRYGLGFTSDNVYLSLVWMLFIKLGHRMDTRDKNDILFQQIINNKIGNV